VSSVMLLAQVIGTFKRGRIADRGPEALAFRASGPNLMIAAIVYWNSTHLADAIERMAADEGLWIFLFSAERGEVTTGCRGSASARKTTSRQASDDQVSICPGAQANSQSQMIRDKLGSWRIPQDGFQWTMKR
jgi:hypothetical protein